MSASLLLLSSLLMAPSSSTALAPRADNACLCTESASSEPCGPERTTCHCVDSPGWTRVRFWAPETSRCEELVFFLMDDDSANARPQ